MQDMDYVYAVYKEKSFSGAAKKLFITQPALSTAVKKVERELGLPLFDRSHTPLRLTDAGTAYIETAEKIFLLQNNLWRHIADLAELESGNLAIGGTNFVVACFLPELIGRFSQLYPKIHLSVTEAGSTELFEQLKKGALDVVVDSGDCSHKEFAYRTLSTDYIILAVPKALTPKMPFAPLSQEDIRNSLHLLPDMPRVHLGDFAETDFLLLSQGNDMNRRCMEFFHDANITPKVRLYLNQLMTAYHMAVSGLGATFLTDTLIRLAAPNDCLNYFLFDHPLNHRDIFIALPKTGYRPKAVTAFLNGIK